MNNEITSTEVVRLLTALKGVYTFKELSEYLRIPSQTLWRYTKYLNVPEKNTAKKILLEIERNNLIYDAFENVININRYGYIETWRINKNIHLLNLFGYLIYRYLKEKNMKINAIIPISIDGIPLATVVSNWISASLYIPYSEAYLTMDRWRFREYLKNGENKMRRIYLPRGIFKRNDKVLMIDIVLEDASIINALYELIEGEDAIPWGVVVALSKNSEWLNDIEYPIEKKIIHIIPMLSKNKKIKRR
jgi:adenine/guanine phosphoribosyltransferase-like PRPP-binding protein